MSAASDADPAAMSRMADRTRTFAWEGTPLGARTSWPLPLCTAVDMMLASLHPMCLIWGPERILIYNDGYAPILGARHSHALGQPIAQVWPELWPELEPLINSVFAGESVAFHDQPLIMTRNGFTEQTWYDFAYSPVRDETGTVVGLLNVTSDSTQRVEAQRERDAKTVELRANEAFMRSVLAASTDCIKVVDLDGNLSFMSEGGMGVMEISDFNAIKGCPWPDFLKEDGPDYARAAIEAAKQGRATHFEAPADTYLGNPKHWSVSVSPIPGPDGEVARILSVSRDHTELERARQQQQLLNGELAHRIKNIMGVVHAIAFQTLGKVAPADALRVFEERLTALSRSHDVLSGQNWSAGQIVAIARTALRTFGEERFTLAGPDVHVGPRTTLSLSLMLHELATNAVKYGALSVPDGRVRLEWSLQRDANEPVLALAWTERGGPPATEPTRKGFGSRIVRMGLIGSGGVTLDYSKLGLTVEARAPLYQVQEA